MIPTHYISGLGKRITANLTPRNTGFLESYCYVFKDGERAPERDGYFINKTLIPIIRCQCLSPIKAEENNICSNCGNVLDYHY